MGIRIYMRLMILFPCSIKLPVIILGLFGVYAMVSVLYGTLTFNDCRGAYEDLKKVNFCAHEESNHHRHRRLCCMPLEKDTKKCSLTTRQYQDITEAEQFLIPRGIEFSKEYEITSKKNQ